MHYYELLQYEYEFMLLTYYIYVDENEYIYFQDFYIRRRMIMKRLDVTIQSFLWGEKAIGKEGEIVAAIQAQRQHLHESPTRYTVSK